MSKIDKSLDWMEQASNSLLMAREQQQTAVRFLAAHVREKRSTAPLLRDAALIRKEIGRIEKKLKALMTKVHRADGSSKSRYWTK